MEKENIYTYTQTEAQTHICTHREENYYEWKVNDSSKEIKDLEELAEFVGLERKFEREEELRAVGDYEKELKEMRELKEFLELERMCEEEEKMQKRKEHEKEMKELNELVEFIELEKKFEKEEVERSFHKKKNEMLQVIRDLEAQIVEQTKKKKKKKKIFCRLQKVIRNIFHRNK